MADSILEMVHRFGRTEVSKACFLRKKLERKEKGKKRKKSKRI